MSDVIAFVGLGSNLGDRITALRAAVLELAQLPQVTLRVERDVASLYETAPVQGPTGQGPYLNSAVRIQTSVPAEELLKVLMTIEADLGRRREERWGSRVIDLDLLLFGDLVLDQPGLCVPHPRMLERRFVLEPMAEIAGNLVHPTAHRTFTDLAQEARQHYPEQHVTCIRGRTWVSDMLPG